MKAIFVVFLVTLGLSIASALLLKKSHTASVEAGEWDQKITEERELLAEGHAAILDHMKRELRQSSIIPEKRVSLEANLANPEQLFAKVDRPHLDLITQCEEQLGDAVQRRHDARQVGTSIGLAAIAGIIGIIWRFVHVLRRNPAPPPSA